MRAIEAVFAAALLGACGSAECPEPAGAEPTAGGQEEIEAAPPGARLPAEVRRLSEAEQRVAPPGTARVWILARGNEAFVARLEMEPGAAVPEHQDADEEYIHVLEGHGTIWIDGERRAVEPGATIFMPAGATVRYQNGDARMVALQVFAGPGSAAKYDRWPLAEDEPEEEATEEEATEAE